MNLGASHERAGGNHRGVVPLGVAGGQDRARPARGLDEPLRLGGRSGQRLLHQSGHAALEEWQCHGHVALGRHGNRHHVDLRLETGRVGARPAAGGRGHLLGPLAIDVDDGHQVDTVQAGQNPRMVPAEVPDADDRRLSGRTASSGIAPEPAIRVRLRLRPLAHSRARPRMPRSPASSARRTISSRSKTSVRPGVDRQRDGARRPHRLDRRSPDDRHVEPHVLIRLRDLHDVERRDRPSARRAGSSRRSPPSPPPRPRRGPSPRSSARCRVPAIVSAIR